MRELHLAEIENVSGGEDGPRTLPPVTTTVPRPNNVSQPWRDFGLSVGEYIFGPGYDSLLIDSPLVLDPVLVQGEAGNNGGTSETNSTNSAIFLYDSLDGNFHWLDAVFLRDGFFDTNGNMVHDAGEITFNEGDTARENLDKYNEALGQYHDQNPGSYAGDGASPEQSAGFLETYLPLPDQNQYF